jgi:hypothetical protein
MPLDLTVILAVPSVVPAIKETVTLPFSVGVVVE